MELYDVDWAFSEVFFWEIPFGMMVSRRRGRRGALLWLATKQSSCLFSSSILLICLLASERL
jgi:hypothetical protein